MFYGDDYGDYGAARTLRPAANQPAGAGAGTGLDRRTSTWQERAAAAGSTRWTAQTAPTMASGAMPEPGLMQIAPPDQMQQGAPAGAGGGSWWPWLAGGVAVLAVAGGGYWWYSSRSGKKSKKDSE
jgi:hypothetical protein